MKYQGRAEKGHAIYKRPDQGLGTRQTACLVSPTSSKLGSDCSSEVILLS